MSAAGTAVAVAPPACCQHCGDEIPAAVEGGESIATVLERIGHGIALCIHCGGCGARTETVGAMVDGSRVCARCAAGVVG